MVTSPVLLIVFNRLDTLEAVMSAVREAAPARLFVAADGPRANRPGEKENCGQVRDFVLRNVDWPCEVKTRFNEKNLGCGKAVSSAITWFFSEVEEGIILEDDCVPSHSFFAYCDELLERYHDDGRVMHIAGHNPLHSNRAGGASYYFARIQHCWGWASWRRAWKHYSFDVEGLEGFKAEKRLDAIFKRKISRDYWQGIFERMERHEIDTWDYQWVYSILKNDGLCVNPTRNLVSNIGFGGGGTHTFDADSPFSNQKRHEIGPLRHPKRIAPDMRLVERVNKVAFGLRHDPIGKMLRPIKKIVKILIGYGR
ncbi:MAG: nucleotide-diphospho-sugar transferase [Spirochaetales bacterium]|nr:nucleotide-diphospho-sugar transferase [Spirochaetales bacterium]